MARGWPAFWTTLIALPFLLGGAYVHLYLPDYPTSIGTVPMLFAGFMILLGLYVHVLVAPEPPAMQPGEEMHVVVSPFSWAAATRFPVFLAFLVMAVYLRFYTDFPVVAAAAAMVACLYFLVTGLVRYWKSSLTVHYVTNRRIITDYRFLWLIRVEVPLPKVTGLEQRKTVMESFLGIGNVVLVTGAGGRRPARIEMHDIRNAMRVRKTIAALRFAHTGSVDDPEDLDDNSLLGPIVDAPSDRIEELVSDLLWRNPDDEPAESDETERSYTVDADLNISLSPTLGAGSGDEQSNENAARTLVTAAANQALSLGNSADDPASQVLSSQLVAGSQTGAALAALLQEQLDNDESDGTPVTSDDQTARTLKEVLRP